MRRDDLESLENLGPCCACRGTEGVRNILILHKRGPNADQGWGCLLCHLPRQGAIAVVCDACLESKATVLEVCDGYPKLGKRVPIESLDPVPFDHDKRYHEEMWTWYRRTGPDTPCSICGLPFDEDEVPLILWRGEGKRMEEARFHFAEECCPIGKGLEMRAATG